MTTIPNKPDRKSSHQLEKQEGINKYDSSLNTETQDRRVKVCLCNRLKLVFKWLSGEAGIALVGIIATLLWNIQTSYHTTKSYSAELINNYINSIKELILDQYHHGKDDKFPEISVEEVEAFIRAKTSNTLKALDKTRIPYWPGTKIPLLPFVNQTITIEKQNLVNFLNGAGIGFLKPVQMETYQYNFLQNVCRKNEILGYGKRYQPKDYTFHHFFCGIDLRNVDLEKVRLDGIILENANLQGTQLKGASLWQANLQQATLYNVDLSDANLTKANLKKAGIVGANLDNAKLNQANLRGVSGWQPLIHQPEDCKRHPDDASKMKCNNGVQANKPASFKGAKLVGVNLHEANLRGVDFSNAKMSPFFIRNEDYILEGKKDKISRTIPTNLRDAELFQANLRGANLREANLRGANLQDAKVGRSWTGKETDLTKAIYDHNTKLPFSDEIAKELGMIKISWGFALKDQNLSDVDLRFAFRCKNDDNKYKEEKGEWVKCPSSIIKEQSNSTNFTNLDLIRADLRGADLSQVIIDDKTKLENALFDNDTELPFDENKAKDLGMIKLVVGADLREKDLSYADLSGVDLSNTNLQGTNLTNINFDEDTKFINAQYNQSTRLPFSRNTVVLYRMRLVVDPTAEEFYPINWEGADLRRSILTNNCQKNPCKNLASGNLQRAKLAYADWRNANLTNAKLQKADLTNANLKEADLTNANLKGANLTNANLKEANLTNANLKGANLTFAQLDCAIIDDTTKIDDDYNLPEGVVKTEQEQQKCKEEIQSTLNNE